MHIRERGVTGAERPPLGPTRAPRRLLASALAVGALLGSGFARPAQAQDSYEIQVYGAELIPVRRTMVEFHTNFTPAGTRETINGIQPTYHVWHETLEITHGFLDWLEVGAYAFTSIREADGWRYVGSHLRPRVTVPESWHWPVGVSLSQEIGFQYRYFAPDLWTWEIRPIVDQQIGRAYWAVNVAFERALTGEGAHAGFDLSPAAKFSFDVTRTVGVGLEYYGSLGPLRNFDPLQSQQHQIFPVLDLDFSPNWEFDLGVGIGLTRATDRAIVKLIVGYRFPF
jgi:hypothetical protein